MEELTLTYSGGSLLVDFLLPVPRGMWLVNVSVRMESTLKIPKKRLMYRLHFGRRQ